MILGVGMSAALIAVVWIDARWPWAPGWLGLSLAAAAAGSWEFTGLAVARGLRPARLWTLAGCLAVVTAQWADALGLGTGQWSSGGWFLGTLAGWSLAAMLRAASRFRPGGQAVESLAADLLTVVYVGVFVGFGLRLRLLPEGAGVAAVVLWIAVVKLGDIGAYAVGKLAGRHRLAPVLSPRKTVEGALGGLSASLATALVLTWLWRPAGEVLPEMVWAGCFGLAVGAAGLAGDLVESFAKRDTGVKDSGRMLGPFGGALDMLDSLLVAAPVAYGLLAVVRRV